MHAEPRIRRNVILGGGLLLLLILGAPTVFSQAPDSATPDPMREVLILRKTALEAEIKAASARILQASRRLKNEKVRDRKGLQGADYVMNAEVDLLEREASVARKRVELKETVNRIEGLTGNSPEDGSAVDVTDDLLRRIKDLEARVDRIDATGREFRLRAPGPNRSMFLD